MYINLERRSEHETECQQDQETDGGQAMVSK